MPFPCRAHAVPLPCRAAKGLECVFPIWFTQCSRVWFTLHIFTNQTRPHCVNQMGKTHSKSLAARHGRGTAWARHAMCESAFRVSCYWHQNVMACSRVCNDVLCNISVANRLDHCLAPCYTRSASPWIIICDQEGKFFPTLKQTNPLLWHRTPHIFLILGFLFHISDTQQNALINNQ
jgi:hypothetical protein